MPADALKLFRSLIGKQQPWVVLSVWLAFVALGMALAMLTPLGEGFDEPLHFAYVQRVAQAWDVPMGHSAFVSEEVEQFLENHPVSKALHDQHPAFFSYEEYWGEDPLVRQKQDQLVRELRFGNTYVESTNSQYERHQPPLYYLLTAPLFSIAAHFLSFTDTFLMVRLWSVLLASLIVPGALLLARGVFEDRPWTKSILLLTVVFPGLYPGVVRVANDSLTVAIASWFLACLVHFLNTRNRSFLIGASILLAAGLSTKAFFIPLLIGTSVVLLALGLFRQFGVMLLIASPGFLWYFYNFLWTGSLTGLPETVMSGSSVASTLDVVWKVDWSNVANVVRSSHIWIGNWSFLNVRGWMYRVIWWFFIAGISGCCLFWRSQASPRALLAILVNYFFFIGALLYYATQVFQSSALSVAEGWYLTLMVPAEAVLFAVGARSLLPRRWPVFTALGGFLLLSLTVYANLFVMLPYYSGFTAHAESGHLRTYVPAVQDLATIPERLLRFHPWIPSLMPVLLIVVFFVASLALTATLFFSSVKKSA